MVQSGAGATVLLADDDEDLREVAGMVFAAAGFELEVVASGAAAEAILATGSYAVAVLDEHMPPGRGLEVAAARRAVGDETPFVLWTGAPRQVDQDAVVRLGLTVVNKTDIQELVRVVTELVRAG